MGKLLTCLARLSFAHLSTPGGTCRRDLESSHRPNGNALLTCNSTLAVPLGSNLVLPGICECQPRLQNSHRPHVRLTICALYCRAAVSMSIPALSQSSTPKCIPIKLPKWVPLELLMCVLMLKSSHRPKGKLTLASCLQGGGVAVLAKSGLGGTMSIIVNSQIYSNTASNVRARVAPMGKLLTCLP